MDYVFGIIVAVAVMAIAWSGNGRGGSTRLPADLMTGAMYFIAFSVGSIAAGALVKALLIVYRSGGAWAGTLIAGGSVASANLAASLAYGQLAGVDFSLGTGVNITWGWTLCFLALSFRIWSGRWPHERRQGRI